MPTKAKQEANKDKEIRFVGHREYFIKGKRKANSYVLETRSVSILEAKLMLVPEATMARIKYWVNEYPIIIQDLKILNKQIYSHEFLEKSKFDTDDFFDNSRTIISLFLETGPEKENWFHKLSLVIRRGKEEIDRANLALMGAPSAPPINSTGNAPSLNMIAQTIPDKQIPTLGERAMEMQPNTVNLEERVQMKAAESIGPPYPDTTSILKSDTEALRSQINEADILNDMAQARSVAQEFRTETIEKDREKKSNDKDSDKESLNSNRTASVKKKLRKQEENLERLLDSPDCLDEAAITLNFLVRRLFCDIFEEPLFKDLMKEKIELKLKEIAVSKRRNESQSFHLKENELCILG